MTPTFSTGTGADDTSRFRPEDVWRVAEHARDFLDGAAAELTTVKRELGELLSVPARAQLLDVGCGTGADVLALAARVGSGGRVVGIDSSEQLIDRARAISAGLPVEFLHGKAGELPFADDTFDVVRSERVIEHVPSPPRALGEMLRVLKPGGQLLVCDPDHGMWALDMTDRDLTQRIFGWWSGHVPNPWIARQLPSLLRNAGAAAVSVALYPVALDTLRAADALTWIGRAAAVAETQRIVTAEEARAWQEELVRRDETGNFLLLGVFVAVTAAKR
jgi:ubiquinone/menaquinone biosynthesis C-methylase UbiE